MKIKLILLISLLVSVTMFSQDELPVNKAFGHNEVKYTYLNGVNFDFSNDSKSSYVGHFNIFVPAHDKIDKVDATLEKKAVRASNKNIYGINVGILKVNYQSTTKFNNIQTDKVLENPLDVIDGDGDSYSLQYNKYSTETKATSYSFYAQPMVRFWKKGAATFYLHTHLEFLATKFETIRQIETIQNKKITIEAGTPIPSQLELIPYLPAEQTQKVDLDSGYFGVGSTIDFNFQDNSILFMQGTLGYALNYADRYPSKDIDGNYNIATSNGGKAFYLVRTYFQYVTSKSTQLVLGTDIRGNFPKESPYFAVYIGLNIGLDKILE